MPFHVAILMKPYIDLLLSGRKTVESRLTRNALPPFNTVKPGERIYFKQSAAPFRAMGVAKDVVCAERLTPQDIARLKRKWNDEVCGDDSYWQQKRESRYATFIRLADIEPIDFSPPFKPSRGPAWFVLEDEHDPLFEISVTEGAIRNGYLRVPVKAHRFDEAVYAGRPVELLLPDGERISSDLLRGGMFRRRGWSKVYARYDVKAGSRLRFVRVGRRRYRVLIPNGEATS